MSLFFIISGVVITLIQLAIAINGIPLSEREVDHLLSARPEGYALNPNSLIMRLGSSTAAGLILASELVWIVLHLIWGETQHLRIPIFISTVAALIITACWLKGAGNKARSIIRVARFVAAVFLLLLVTVSICFQVLRHEAVNGGVIFIGVISMLYLGFYWMKRQRGS